MKYYVDPEMTVFETAFEVIAIEDETEKLPSGEINFG